MDLIKQKGKKVGPIKDIANKFKYSFQGLAYCFTHETSFIFETLGIIAIIIFGIIFKIEFWEWCCSIISMLNIVQIELLNTGIEATVDMVTKEFNPFAKIAKDCGSAATCIATLIAFAINGIVFIPRFISLFVK